MDLELRHLRVVVTVAECGSVTKAAAALGLAQPALTAQLNRIDRTLGGPVFVRDRTGSRPTELGKLVLRHARVLLPAMDTLVDDARRHVNARPGAGSALRVGTANTVVGGLFVNRLHAALPGTALTTSMSWSVRDLAADLAAGALDVALVGVCADAAPAPTGGVVWTRVATDPVFVLLAEEHPHATHDAVPLAELADAHWLTGPGDDCFDRCFVAACARAGFTPRGIGTTERASAVEQVRGGHAVGLVQPLLLDLPGVWAVPIAGEPLRWSHYVGWRDGALPVADAAVAEDAAVAAHAEAVRRSPCYRAYRERAGRPDGGSIARRYDPIGIWGAPKDAS